MNPAAPGARHRAPICRRHCPVSTRPDIAFASIPRDCDAVQTERRTTSVLGAGLLEAIDDGESRTSCATSRLRPEPAPDPEGLGLFRQVGCDGCHRESYPLSGAPAPFGDLDAPLYSDLLLHDIGTGDGMVQGSAGADELRTAPLWGLSRSPFYLHDGRALGLDQAIVAHAGQADAARRAYQALTDTDREQLLDFLAAL